MNDTPALRSDFDIGPFRRRLYAALYDDTALACSLEDTIQEIADAAARQAERGNWRPACDLYNLILAECLKDTRRVDDIGAFVEALQAVTGALADLLGRYPETAADDAARRAVFDSLLDAYIWDMDFGGVGLSDDIPECILSHVTPDDLPGIRARLHEAQRRAEVANYSKWAAVAYACFLAELDSMDDAGPEDALAWLREQGHYELLFEKLLEMARINEATEVVKDHLTDAHTRLNAVKRLADAGHADTAMRLAQQSVQAGQTDLMLIEWLLSQHTARGEQEACLFLLRRRMMAYPNISHYAALKEAAAALGRWEMIRPHVVAWLEEQKNHVVLTRVYLHDQMWDAAWAALTKAIEAEMPPGSGYKYPRTYQLELEVAEQSQFARPRRALEVYVKYARHSIDQGVRNPMVYRQAIHYLRITRSLYHQVEDAAGWERCIARIRNEFSHRSALMRELSEAGL
ncbi:MAG: hypothetical protein JXB47_12650 [Anaerolineae bacterium]|nr:hypothetical protein [Anaerolineae bacterium]